MSARTVNVKLKTDVSEIRRCDINDDPEDGDSDMTESPRRFLHIRCC
jgi:hypothetical protein